MLYDSHCHLNMEAYADDLNQIIDRATLAGVHTLLTISIKISQVPDVIAIAEQYPQVYASIGVHPHEAAHEPIAEVHELVTLTEHPKVVGIGETGLDFYYEKSPRDKQEESFRNHIAASRQTGIPLIVHTRSADGDTIRIMKEEAREKGGYPGVIHCFSSGVDVAKMALDLGFMISISGIITFKKAQDLQDIVKTLPINRLLIETDAPYLAPMPYRGKRNEPAFIIHTAEKLAAIMDVPQEKLISQLHSNFLQTFSKITPHKGA